METDEQSSGGGENFPPSRNWASGLEYVSTCSHVPQSRDELNLKANQPVEILDQGDPTYYLVRTWDEDAGTCRVGWVPISIIERRISESAQRSVSRDRSCSRVNERIEIRNRRQELINDFLVSEQRYIKDLGCFVSNFQALLNDPNCFMEIRRCRDTMLTTMIKLMNFHERIFIKDLCLTNGDAENMGNCFMKNKQAFDLYVKYFSDMNECEKTFDSMSSETIAFLDEYLQVATNITDRPLMYFLTRPIERIEIYREFLKDQVKSTYQLGENVHKLSQAFGVINNVFNQIRYRDLLDRIVVMPFDWRGLGEVLRHDNIRLNEDVKWLDRDMFLLQEHILICKPCLNSSGANVGMEFDKFIQLRNMVFMQDYFPDEDRIFELRFRNSSLMIGTESVFQKASIIRCLRNNLLTLGLTVNDVGLCQTLSYTMTKASVDRDSLKKGCVIEEVEMIESASEAENDLMRPYRTYGKTKTVDYIEDADFPSRRGCSVGDRMLNGNHGRNLTPVHNTSILPDDGRLPQFVKPLIDKLVCEGDSIILQCEVVSSTPIRATWYKNGIVLQNTVDFSQLHRCGTLELKIKEASSYDAAIYSIRVSNQHGTTSSDCRVNMRSQTGVHSGDNMIVESSQTKILPIRTRSTSQIQATSESPAFSTPLFPVTSRSGEDATFQCKIQGIPSPSIQWYKDDVPIENSAKYNIWYMNPDVKLTVRCLSISDEGVYTLRISNLHGEATSRSRLQITGIDVSGNGSYGRVDSPHRSDHEHRSTTSIYCPQSAVSRSRSVPVQDKRLTQERVTSRQLIGRETQSLRVSENSIAVFRTHTSAPYQGNLRWYQDNNEILSSNNRRVISRRIDTYNHELIIREVLATDYGQYYASDSVDRWLVGSLSPPLDRRASSAISIPEVVFVSKLLDQTVSEGGSACFQCKINQLAFESTTLGVCVDWYRQGQKIDDSEFGPGRRFSTEKAADGVYRLYVHDVKADDEGEYAASCGSARSAAWLHVKFLPPTETFRTPQPPSSSISATDTMGDHHQLKIIKHRLIKSPASQHDLYTATMSADDQPSDRLYRAASPHTPTRASTLAQKFGKWTDATSSSGSMSRVSLRDDHEFSTTRVASVGRDEERRKPSRPLRKAVSQDVIKGIERNVPVQNISPKSSTSIEQPTPSQRAPVYKVFEGDVIKIGVSDATILDTVIRDPSVLQRDGIVVSPALYNIVDKSIIFDDVKLSQAGHYQFALKGGEQMHQIGEIQVEKRPIKREIMKLPKTEFIAGETLYLECEFQTEPKVAPCWYKGNKQIISMSVFGQDNNIVTKHDGCLNSLTIHQVKREDEGIYELRSGNFILTTPYIKVTDNDDLRPGKVQNLNLGDTLNIDVKTSQMIPDDRKHIRLWRENVDITNQPNVSMTSKDNSMSIAVDKVGRGDSGSYFMEISGCRQHLCKVEVNPEPRVHHDDGGGDNDDELTAQPLTPTVMKVSPGRDINIGFRMMQGVEHEEVTWLKDGSGIISRSTQYPDSRYEESREGNEVKLKIQDVRKTDGGKYSICTVESNMESSPITVGVTSEPLIEETWLGRFNVYEGQSITFKLPSRSAVKTSLSEICRQPTSLCVDRQRCHIIPDDNSQLSFQLNDICIADSGTYTVDLISVSDGKDVRKKFWLDIQVSPVAPLEVEPTIQPILGSPLSIHTVNYQPVATDFEWFVRQPRTGMVKKIVVSSQDNLVVTSSGVEIDQCTFDHSGIYEVRSPDGTVVARSDLIQVSPAQRRIFTDSNAAVKTAAGEPATQVVQAKEGETVSIQIETHRAIVASDKLVMLKDGKEMSSVIEPRLTVIGNKDESSVMFCLSDLMCSDRGEYSIKLNDLEIPAVNMQVSKRPKQVKQLDLKKTTFNVGETFILDVGISGKLIAEPVWKKDGQLIGTEGDRDVETGRYENAYRIQVNDLKKSSSGVYSLTLDNLELVTPFITVIDEFKPMVIECRSLTVQEGDGVKFMIPLDSIVVSEDCIHVQKNGMISSRTATTLLNLSPTKGRELATSTLQFGISQVKDGDQGLYILCVGDEKFPVLDLKVTSKRRQIREIPMEKTVFAEGDDLKVSIDLAEFPELKTGFVEGKWSKHDKPSLMQDMRVDAEHSLDGSRRPSFVMNLNNLKSDDSGVYQLEIGDEYIFQTPKITVRPAKTTGTDVEKSARRPSRFDTHARSVQKVVAVEGESVQLIHSKLPMIKSEDPYLVPYISKQGDTPVVPDTKRMKIDVRPEGKLEINLADLCVDDSGFYDIAFKPKDMPMSSDDQKCQLVELEVKPRPIERRPLKMTRTEFEEGESLRVDISAPDGMKVSPVWFKDEHEISPQEGSNVQTELTANTASLCVDNLVPSDSGVYEVKVGNIVYQTPKLVVNPKRLPLEIIEPLHLLNPDLKAGEPVKFKCTFNQPINQSQALLVKDNHPCDEADFITEASPDGCTMFFTANHGLEPKYFGRYQLCAPPVLSNIVAVYFTPALVAEKTRIALGTPLKLRVVDVPSGALISFVKDIVDTVQTSANPVLDILEAQQHHQGTYKCVCKISSEVELQSNEVYIEVAPSFSIRPKSDERLFGHPFAFYVPDKAIRPEDITALTCDGRPVDEVQIKRSGDGSEVGIYMPELKKLGEFQAVLKDGKKSSPVLLDKFTDAPSKTLVKDQEQCPFSVQLSANANRLFEGEILILNCSTSDICDLRWFYNGRPLDIRDNENIQYEKIDKQHILILKNATPQSHSGEYKCCVEKGSGNFIYSNSVDVEILPELKFAGNLIVDNHNPPHGKTIKLIVQTTLPVDAKVIKPFLILNDKPFNLPLKMTVLDKAIEFTIPNVGTKTHSGVYTCNLTSDTMKTVLASSPVNVLVARPVLEPDYLDVESQGSVVIKCTSSSTAEPTWYHNGRKLQDTSKVLKIDRAMLENAGQYTCSIESDESEPCRVTVKEPKTESSPLKFISPLRANKQSLNAGEPLILECKVDRDAETSNPVIYREDGKPVKSSIEVKGPLIKLIIASCDSGDSGTYNVVVDGVKGDVPVMINVKSEKVPLIMYARQGPAVGYEMELDGTESVELVCETESADDLEMYKDGKVDGKATLTKKVKKDSQWQSCFKLAEPECVIAGTYVAKGLQCESNPVILTAPSVPHLEAIPSEDIAQGSSFSLRCSIKKPKSKLTMGDIKLYLNEKPIGFKLDNVREVLDATEAVLILTIDKAKRNDHEGKYAYKLKDGLESNPVNMKITPSKPTAEDDDLRIVKALSDVTVDESQSFELVCELNRATSNPPQWRKDDKIIDFKTDGGRVHASMDGNLLILKIQRAVLVEDNCKWSCCISPKLTTTCSVKVNPLIMNKFSKYLPETVQAAAGKEPQLVLECETKSDEPAVWTVNGRPVKPGDNQNKVSSKKLSDGTKVHQLQLSNPVESVVECKLGMADKTSTRVVSADRQAAPAEKLEEGEDRKQVVQAADEAVQASVDEG